MRTENIMLRICVLVAIGSLAEMNMLSTALILINFYIRKECAKLVIYQTTIKHEPKLKGQRNKNKNNLKRQLKQWKKTYNRAIIKMNNKNKI